MLFGYLYYQQEWQFVDFATIAALRQRRSSSHFYRLGTIQCQAINEKRVPHGL